MTSSNEANSNAVKGPEQDHPAPARSLYLRLRSVPYRGCDLDGENPKLLEPLSLPSEDAALFEEVAFKSFVERDRTPERDRSSSISRPSEDGGMMSNHSPHPMHPQ